LIVSFSEKFFDESLLAVLFCADIEEEIVRIIINMSFTMKAICAFLILYEHGVVPLGGRKIIKTLKALGSLQGHGNNNLFHRVDLF
jgi:hypothetical protein